MSSSGQNYENVDGEDVVDKKKSYWGDLVSRYERRNASLERRHDTLAERVRLMELALPSVLMGAIGNLNHSSNSPDHDPNLMKSESLEDQGEYSEKKKKKPLRLKKKLD